MYHLVFYFCDLLGCEHVHKQRSALDFCKTDIVGPNVFSVTDPETIKRDVSPSEAVWIVPTWRTPAELAEMLA